MLKYFGSIAFTPEVKSLQKRHGSFANYERIEKRSTIEGLSEFEVNFINSRDSFYMASIGENGYPYIQHRGGPKGFVKIIDKYSIGFIDFSGNKQYITAGNLSTNSKVSVFMMDYPAKARLKFYATAEIIDLSERPELLKLLTLDDYPSKPERMILLHIEAYDWNCPQHITQRFTVEELERALAPQREYIRKLEKELKELKN